MHAWLQTLAHAREALSIIAGVIFIAGYVPYILAILRDRHFPADTPGKSKPAKASWIIWAVLDTITLVGMIAKGATNGQMIGTIIGAYATVGFALKFGKSGWSLLDRCCLGGAALGIVLGVITSNPDVAISISCSVIFLGAIPTFTSAWENPSRENSLAWSLFWYSCLFALAAIPAWTIADALQPITFTVIESIMMVLLFVRPRRNVRR